MGKEMNEIATIEKSLDGRITKWDDAAERIFGYTREEAIGKHISLVIPFDYQDEEYEMLDRLKQEEVLELRRTMRRSKDGRFFPVMLKATALRDAEGKIIGARKRVQRVPEEQGDNPDNKTCQTTLCPSV